MSRNFCLFSFGSALFVRLALLLYGEWQDTHNIDYFVYSDAARYVWEGQSPYNRSTYRYTPLLAIMLTPNIVFQWFGKVLFVLCDMLAGYCIWIITSSPSSSRPHNPDHESLWSALRERSSCALLLWLWNPLVFTVSTRGSSDVMVVVLLLLALVALVRGSWKWAGVFYGISVHFKLYPIIYSIGMLAFVGTRTHTAARRNSVWRRMLFLDLTTPQWHFFFSSALTFVVLTGGLVQLYGLDVLEHSYFYHFRRIDTRHNFSLQFYSLYLHEAKLTPAADAVSYFAPAFTALAHFAPQMVLVLVLGWRYAATDLPLCMFLQTMTFVAFNKVCTAQYFLWYVGFLPLVVCDSDISPLRGLVMGVLWLCTELHWLSWAFQLEFLGRNVFLELFGASALFYVAHVWIVCQFISHHRRDTRLEGDSLKSHHS